MLTKRQPREHRTHTPSNRIRPCGELMPPGLFGSTTIDCSACMEIANTRGATGATVTAHPPEQRRIAWSAGVKRSSVERAREQGSAAGIRLVHAPEWTAPGPSTRRGDPRLRHRLQTPDRLLRDFSRPRAGVRMPVAERAPRSGATVPTPVSRLGVRCRTQGHDDQTSRGVTAISGSCPDPSPPDLR